MLTRVGKSIDAAGLTKYRTYSLAVSPVDSTEVRSILSSTSDSIAKLLEEPPELRYGGWGMETGDRAKLIAGELRRVKSDEYKVVDLYRDGTLVFACRADEALLGWGNTFGRTRINPIALVEITYMFFNFYDVVLKKLDPPAKDCRVWIQFQNLHESGEITSLAPHGVAARTQRIDFYRHNAPESNYLGRISIAASSFDASKAALVVLKEIYAWFGIEAEKIPYLTDDNSAVDVEKIKNPKS